jgi:NB-ARC domain
VPTIPGPLEALATKVGIAGAKQIYEWSKGSEAKQLTKLLKKEHPAAPKLLLQPDCLIELRVFSTTGRFDRTRMLAAVSQVERDPAAAEALVDAIHSTQWRTKRDEEHVHFELLKLKFDLRAELTDATEPVLRRLEAIEAEAARRTSVPRQLPRVGASFTDRERELDRIKQALTAAADHGGASANVVAISGVPGVGKSALGARAAHDVAKGFSDGQLYANLRAPDGTVIPLTDAIADLLRALGVAEVPAAAGSRAALLRTELAEKRTLLFLDNVRDDEAITDLIPATPTCAVLVTSYDLLVDLEPDEHVLLKELAEEDAVALLDRVLADGRVSRDRDAAHLLVTGSGRLPLALKAIAGCLKRQPELTLAKAVVRLRAGELDESLQRSFTLPYGRLGKRAASLFRMLGAVRAVTVSPELASALALTAEADIQDLFDEIAEAGLLEKERDGVRLHELMHRFAAQQLAADPAEEALAQERLAGWFLERGERLAEIIREERDNGA